MKKIAVFFLAAFALVTAGPVLSARDSKPTLDQALTLIDVWVDAQLAYHDIPGMSVGIVHDQDLVWRRGFGFAHVEKQEQATPRTIYSICSISKLFTSIAVLQLRDQGKLSLDEPIKTYLPWFDIQDAFPEAPPINLRGILTHSSGLPREADYPYWTGPEHDFPTVEEIRARLSGQAELYPARTYFQYSNLGMSLAGMVVEAVSGQPYAEYTREHILDPLGMTDTSAEIPAGKRGGQLATPYSGRLREGGRAVIPFYLVNGIAPAAGYASTVEDLARFASWQFRLLARGGSEVLAVNSLREMQRVHWVNPDWKTTWGLGFSISRRDERTYVGHGGSCPGYRTQVSLRNQDKLAVIVMTNGHDVSPSAYANQIFDVITPALASERGEPAKQKPDPGLEEYSGRYIRPVGRESHILVWEDGLAMTSLPTDSPARSLTRLKRSDRDVFRRIRDNGELGEEVIFERSKDGRVSRYIHNSQPADRVR